MSHRNQANQLGVTYFRPDFILCTLTTRDDQDASDIRSDDYRHFWSYHQLTKNIETCATCESAVA